MVNVDLAPGADLRCDLFKKRWLKRQYKWPFKTASVDLIYTSHFVEHVPDWDAFWTEAYRVMKPGGYFVAITPYYTSVGASQDPDHKQLISPERYSYLSREWREKNDMAHYGANVDFRKAALLFDFDEDFADKDYSVIAYAMRHYMNVVRNLGVVLEKLPRV
jgi:SAM-dependent methyltransferase